MQMKMKRFGLSLLILLIIGTVFGLKAWQKQTASTSLTSKEVKGPAVILIRGDNSPSCRAIHTLVERAAVRHGQQINFVQVDWADDNPLLKKYKIQFLPTVVFVNKHDQEVARIIGESPAVQQKLRQSLTELNDLLE